MIENIVHCLRSAHSIVVLTGAGISAESGIPTFRDALTGLWASYKPEELATFEAFERNPEKITRWYDERRIRCADCAPNPGHYALVELEKLFYNTGRQFTLLTQNVDRLHQRAGSRHILELHGTLWSWRCVICGIEKEEIETSFVSYPPRCGCGGMRRPGVVWFGELLPQDVLDQAHRALSQCDLFMSLGTSAVVEPVASFGYIAKAVGAKTIEINLEATPFSLLADHSLSGKTGELLPQIIKAVNSKSTSRVER